ncbi:MAG: hypothetical protein KC501_23010 [Myxococcales bacterium]|nr:hypothetical protein [Myxococcales bacterium]
MDGASFGVTTRTTIGALALALGASVGACTQEEPAGADDGPEGTTGHEPDPTTGDAESTGAGMQEPPPTWYQDVAPIVLGRCAGCHTPGGIAPVPLHDYESARPLATLLAASVEDGTMPPFAAAETAECEMHHGWQDDLRLSDDEKALLWAWADAGAPKGDPSDPAPVPEPPSLELATVDTHVQIDASVTIEGPNDRFLCFSLDPGLDEDRYLQAMQIVPGNDEIVHHVLLFVDEDGSSAAQAGEDGSYPCSGGSQQGELIGAWAPGSLPIRTPPDVGFLVPAGSRLVMNVHYHPTGAPQVDDATGIDLDWMDERPPYVGQLALIGNGQGLLPGPNDDGGPEFRIPAGVSGHTEAMLFTLPSDIPELRLWSIGAHMHYLGVDMIIGVKREASGGPEEECLLQTPTYSFEWQRSYVYDRPLDELPRLAGGDKLYMRCTYDNTLDNPGVVEALQQQGLSEPIEVNLGEETLDEMCLGVYGLVIPNIF